MLPLTFAWAIKLVIFASEAYVGYLLFQVGKLGRQTEMERKKNPTPPVAQLHQKLAVRLAYASVIMTVIIDRCARTKGHHVQYDKVFALHMVFFAVYGATLGILVSVNTGFKSRKHGPIAYTCCASFVGLVIVGSYMTLTRF